MKRLRKRIPPLLLALLLLLQLFPSAFAGETYPTPSASGTIRTCMTASSGKAYAYTSSNLTQKTGGYAVPSDFLYITRIEGSALYGKYNVGSGYKWAWFKRSDFSPVSLTGNAADYFTATGTVTTYKRSSGSTRMGSIAAGDQVFVTGAAANGRTLVVYQLSGSRYSTGWISTASLPAATPDSSVVNVSRCTITSALKSGLVLDLNNNDSSDGSNIQVYPSNGSGAQDYSIVHVGNGWHKIVHTASGKVLDVAGGVRGSGVNVWLYSYNGTDAQMWKFIPVSGGGYYIQNKLGFYLDVQGGVAGQANVWVYQGNQSKAQLWFLESISTASTASTASSWQYPVTNSYVCGNNWAAYYSARPSRPYHVGLDIASKTGDRAIYAAADGTIVRSGWNSSNGYYVVIQHTLSGKTVYSFYAHLSSITRGSGTVSRGTKIGVIGNTGSGSAGTHLHFAVVSALWSGSYYGYVPSFTGNKTTYCGVTYYNPHYIIQNGTLPA